MQRNLLKRSTSTTLIRIFRELTRRFGRELLPFDISAEQAHILLVLWSEGPLTIGALQRAVSLSGPTLTGALQRLEQAERIRRTQSSQDRRVWVIEAVPWPAQRRERLVKKLQEVEDAAFRVLTKAERQLLHELLGRVEAGLDEQGKPAEPRTGRRATARARAADASR